MKTAMITGASRGIGLAIAARLQQDGCNVAILDLAEESAAEANMNAAGLEKQRRLYLRGDVTRQDCRDAFLQQTVERFGEVNILVNNAGVAPRVRADLLDMSEESFDFVLGVNVKGNLGMSQTVARHMLARPLTGRRRGVIVNVSSCSAYATSTNRGEYCVSKAGVSMLTQLFADRLAEEGVNVFEVRPGIIATDMTAGVKEKYDDLILNKGILPIRRWGTPEDVAGAVSLLCDERLCYCTGDVLNVDGGFHIQRL